ncbi:MAG TPA: hypothetical protein VII36_01815 [Usitatibacter sp.]
MDTRGARRIGLAALLCATALLAAGCGQQKTPKVDQAAERAAALERSKKGAFGTQVNALETAKGLEADVNKKAQESIDSIEKDAK